jgi:hypothetical protein
MKRLSSSERIARVTSIRVAAVNLIQAKGSWEPVRVRGEQRKVMGLRLGSLSMSLTTPFQKFHMEPPKIPDRIKGDYARYGAAALMSRLKPHLGFGLDVWGTDGKVLNVLWNNEGEIEIVSFKRGDWEEEILDAVSMSTVDGAISA